MTIYEDSGSAFIDPKVMSIESTQPQQLDGTTLDPAQQDPTTQTVAIAQSGEAIVIDSAVSTGNSDRSSFMHSRVGKAIATGTALFTLGAIGAGCANTKGNGHNAINDSFVRKPSNTGSATVANRAAIEDSSLQAVLNGPLHEEDNASLASGGYNCGHTIELSPNSPYSYNNQISYLNEKPQLAQNLIDFQINDPVYGMGKSAWQVVESQAIVNPATASSDVVTASPDMNKYAHDIFTVELDASHSYLNFTCDNPETGAITPVTIVNEIKVTGNVNGLMFTQQGLDAFQAAMLKYPDGQSKFDVIDLGTQEIVDPATGDTVTVPVFMVVTESEGCLNPNRVIPTTAPKPPATTTTTKAPTKAPNVTTTTGKASVTTTTIPGTTTTSTTPSPTTSTTSPPPQTTTPTTFIGPKPPATPPVGTIPSTTVPPKVPSGPTPTTSTTTTTQPETTTPTTVYIPPTTETTQPQGTDPNLP